MQVDLELLFDNFVRDYRTFGLSKDCTYSRYTTEYIRWFAQEGIRLGYHADQEVEYKESKELSKLYPLEKKQEKRLADLIWVTDPKRNLNDDVFVLHLESETNKDNRNLTIDLLAFSPFRPLHNVVACLHRIEGNRAGFSSGSLRYAITRFRGSGRTLLLLINTVWDEGDFLYGYIIDGRGKPRKKRASCVLHKWRGAEYFGLKPENDGDEDWDDD